MELHEIVGELKQTLSEKRFVHSLGVSKTAEALAKRFHCDPAKAKLAGVLHDCAREFSPEVLLREAPKLGVVIDTVEQEHPILLHAPVGAKIACAHFKINDPEILQAIEMHTVGGERLTGLAKIIYLADFIEPGRNFPGVERLRLLAENGLDKALLAAYDSSIKYIVDRYGLIHPNTIYGRNELLIKKSC